MSWRYPESPWLIQYVSYIYLNIISILYDVGCIPILDHFRTPPHGISIIKNLGYMIYDTYHTVNIT